MMPAVAASRTCQPTRAWRGTQLFCAVLLLTLSSSSLTRTAAAARLLRDAAAPGPALALSGTREEIEGTEVVWQLPAELPPKGLLLVFHGCGHASTDFWPQGPACPSCIGLPEEVAITSTALRRGYGMLSISSRDRQHRRCWALPYQPEAPGVDVTAVVAVVRAFVARQQLQGVPLYALGASSGGAFVLILPHYLQLSAACSQIMALPREWYHAFIGSAAAQQSPLLFVHMPKDERTAASITELVKLRQEKGLASRVVDVGPHTVTPDLLSRVPGLEGETGVQLVALLKAHKLLDEAGMLTQDPRHTHWARIIRDSALPGASSWNLTANQSGLSELLNRAWASHEIVSSTTTDMLDWFEQQTAANSAAG